MASNVQRARVVMSCTLLCWGHGLGLGRTSTPPAVTVRFVEAPCGERWGTSADIAPETVKCGTVTVPQDRGPSSNPRLSPVVLPVVVYSSPGARGTPIMFLTGGPGQSSIATVQQLLLKTPIGEMLIHDHPIIAFDRRGYSPVSGRAMPDLGTVTFEPRSRRELAIAPLADSLVRRTRDLRTRGVEPRNFTTLAVVEDMADVMRALHVDKVVLFGASYGTHEALQFMRLHPEMVESAILDGVAPPSATQVLDSAYMAGVARGIVARIVIECHDDAVCAAQYPDLARAVMTLSDSATAVFRRTAHFPGNDGWRTIDVTGASVLTVLGVSAASEEVRANVPRIIVEFAGRDTVNDEFSPSVLVAAATDPSLQIATRQTAPLVHYIALCGDRPQGDPKARNRKLCDALGVPFAGPEAVASVTSDAPTLLISSGYDAQTPAQLADEAAKTLSHARRVSFPTSGHVAFPRPVVSACVAIVVDAFLRYPGAAPPMQCAARLMPAFLPRGDSLSKSERR